MKNNLAGEIPFMRGLFESNVYYKPLKRQPNLILTAGVFPSHIGIESARGMNCWALTRSIQADNSPYYESGLSIQYSLRKCSLGFLVLNGWQNMRIFSQFKLPAVGHSFSLKSTQVSVGSHSFFGPSDPRFPDNFRAFHNFQIEKIWRKFGIQFALDAGYSWGDKKGLWWSPAVHIRWKPGSNTSLCGRAEWYHDDKKIIIPSLPTDKCRVGGVSFNFDWTLNQSILCRYECRWLVSDSSIFPTQNNMSHHSLNFTAALMIEFERLFRFKK